MSKDWTEIRNIMAMRRSYDQAIIRRMIQVRDRNNGDLTIPMPTLPTEPEFQRLAPALVQDGIDNTAMRAAGPNPTIHCPAVDESKERGKESLAYADIRRRALYARWHSSRLKAKLRRAYRQLVGYGTLAFSVEPDFEGNCARIKIRDPLGAYPEIRTAEDFRPTTNCGFVFGQSPEWIIRRYPEARKYIESDRGHNYRSGDDAGLALWDLVEWVDEDDIVVGILGPRAEYLSAPSSVTPNDQRYSLGQEGQFLRRWKNKAGMCPVVVPRRVTLDRVAGQMEIVLPIIDWLERLMALEVAAAERAVFPDIAIYGDGSGLPRVVGGGWKDGRTGEPNLLEHVKGIQPVQGGPSPLATQMVDRLERNARVSSGANPMFGGETLGAATRTGRGMESMAGFSIDPRIQEVQELMSMALEEVNQGIIAIEKGYFGRKQMTVFSGWPSERGMVAYQPNKHFESDDNVVSYTFPGSDITQVTVAVGQMVAGKLMSRHTARTSHPYVEDAIMEEKLIFEEAFDDAILIGAQQKIQTGELPFEAAVEIRRQIANGVPRVDAISDVVTKLQEKQAQAQQQTQAGQGADVAANPEMQRGAGPPGTEPAALATVQGPSPSQVNVSNLVRNLTAPAKRLKGV